MQLKRLITTSTLLSMACFNAYAFDYVPGKAHHPIHIKKIPTAMYKQPSGMSPQQLRTAYGLDQIAAQGKGQIVAIVDAFDDPNIESDLATFSSAFSLPACTTANGCFKKIYASGTKPPANAGWAGEISLDVEWVHAVAPWPPSIWWKQTVTVYKISFKRFRLRSIAVQTLFR